MTLEKQLSEKVKKYEKLTKKALNEIELSEGLSEKEERVARTFLEMSENYFKDAGYFKKKGDLLTALASLSYAHAWLDAGVKARLFTAKDDQLFTLP